MMGCCQNPALLNVLKGEGGGEEEEEEVKVLFNYFFVGARSKLVQLWLTAANSPQSQSFKSALSVSAHSNMKAWETCVYLLLTGPSLLLSPLWLCAITAAFV